MFLNFLKYINSIPVPLTLKHYYSFPETSILLKNDELNSPESWDVLRENDPHFSIAKNREEWLKASNNLIRKDGQDGGLIKRAEIVNTILNKRNFKTVFSVGVGGAGLEYQIKKMNPDIKMVCSEYAKISVDLLKAVFIEADSVILFDILNGDWQSELSNEEMSKSVVLMYRVDINFTDDEMFKIFSKMSVSSVENIFVILCGTLTLRGIVNRLKQRLSGRINGRKYLFAGYLRSKKKSISFWEKVYDFEELDCAGLPGFVLKKKS